MTKANQLLEILNTQSVADLGKVPSSPAVDRETGKRRFKNLILPNTLPDDYVTNKEQIAAKEIQGKTDDRGEVQEE